MKTSFPESASCLPPCWWSFLALALFLAGCSPQARVARYLERADQYYSDGEYDKATIEYQNGLRLDKSNGHALARLGLIYAAQGRNALGFAVLSEAGTRTPENLEVRLRLAALHFMSGNRREAWNQASEVLKQRPNDPDAPLLMAEAAESAAEIEATRKRLMESMGGAPDPSASEVALAVLDLRQHRFPDADARLRKVLAADPSNSAANFVLGSLLRLQGDRSGAESALQTAASRATPRSPRRLAFAQFKLETGDLATARQALQEITRATPDLLPAWALLAKVEASSGDFEACAACIHRILDRDPTHPETLLLQGWLNVATGDLGKAVTALERIVRLYPRSAWIHLQLAGLYRANREISKAVARLDEAMALDPGLLEARMLRARIHIENDEFAAAATLLAPAADAHPRQAPLHLLLADALRRQGKLDECMAIYERLQREFPENAEPFLLIGLLRLEQGRHGEARECFERVLQLNPDSLVALEKLVTLDLKEPDSAADRMRTELARAPHRPEAWLLLARVHLESRNVAEAETALRKALELLPGFRNAQVLLARVLIDTSRHAEAVSLLEKIPQDPTPDLEVLTLLGALFHHQGNYQSAQATYERVLALQPKSGPALHNLAFLYTQTGDLDRAREVATRLRELLPSDPQAADSLGWVLYLRREYTRALNLLRESAGKLPDVPEVQYHLGMAHAMMGQEELARAALQRAVAIQKDFPGKNDAQRHLDLLHLDGRTAGPEALTRLEQRLTEDPDNPVILSRVAAIHEQVGSLDRAIAAYDAILRRNAEHTAALLGLVRVHGRIPGNEAKALQASQEARRLDPRDPEIAHTVGRFAWQNGDAAWAQSLLAEAARQQPQNADVLFDWSLALHDTGRISEAKAVAERAMQSGESFARAADATEFLRLVTIAGGEPVEGQDEIVTHALEANRLGAAPLAAAAAIDRQHARWESARDRYREILARFPEFGPAKRGIALASAALPGSDPDGFKGANELRIELHRDIEFARALGILAYRERDYARAIAALSVASEVFANDGLVHFYLGMARFNRQQTTESQAALTTALALGLPAELASEARETLKKLNL